MKRVVISTSACTLALVLLAGCATTHTGRTRTASAADRLERSADAFAAGTCHEPNAGCASGPYVPAARAFAGQAHDFRQALGEVSDRDVVLAYQRLWSKYHGLRHEVDRSQDSQLQTSLKPTTEAFRDVQQHVKAWFSDADTGVYGRGGYVLDPYYN